MPEPEAAGAVDVACGCRCHSWYPGFCAECSAVHDPTEKLKAALAAANARAERLAAAVREIEGRVSDKENDRGAWFSQGDRELRDVARAALAVDAPGRGEG